MMLGTELEEFTAVDSLGEEIGKIKDVIVDTKGEEWNIKEFMVSKGLLKGEAVFCFEDIKKFDEDEKRIALKDGVDLQDFDEEKLSHKYLSMDAVKDRDVFDSKEEEIGKIYDYVLATSLTPWQVVKILIRPSENRLKGRRIRLDVEKITKIKEVITVKISRDEADKTSSEE